MNREIHVRICESLRGQFPRATRPAQTARFRRPHVLVVPIHPLRLSASVLADFALPRGSAYRLSSQGCGRRFDEQKSSLAPLKFLFCNLS